MHRKLTPDILFAMSLPARTKLLSLAMMSLTLPACIAPAQTIGTGSIQGTVTDSSGAVVRGATVLAVDPANGYTETQHTSGAGSYTLVSLPPSTYRVTVSAPGFANIVREQVVVNALAQSGLDISLNIGAGTETVVVSTLPPQLDTSNGSLEVTLPNSVYSELPLALSGGPKNPLGFVTLLPGTAPGPYGINNLNGGPGQSSFLYINGLPVVTSELQGDARNIQTETSTEVVDQFQVITSGVPAYYTGQGVTNLIMKSGTNNFHGDVYENIRNTVFDARGYIGGTKPVERQNEFGGSLGGRILKDRLFFFGNYDGWRYTSSSTASIYSLPTVAERSGDFSALSIPIYDPASTVCTAAGVCTRTAFPNNQIPISRISPVSQSLQSYLPGQNALLNGNLQNNYLGALTSGQKQDMFLVKLDFTVTPKNHLYSLTQYGKNQSTSLGFNGGPQLPLPYTSSRYGNTTVSVEQIGDTQQITSNLINVFGYQINRFVSPFLNATTSNNYASKAGLTGLPAGEASQDFPQVAFGGINSPTPWAISGNSVSFADYATTNTFQDNVQWVRGRHSMTFGAQVMLESENQYIPSSVGGFGFSNNETAGFDANGNLVTTTGNAYASYLLGVVDGASVTDNAVQETGGRYRNYAFYAQDDWKITPKLTVNAGVRYVIPKPFIEAHDRESWFNLDLPNPTVAHLGALQFAGNGPDSCHCRTRVQTHYLSFEPRVGFAFSPNSKSVFRGSFTLVHFNAGALGGNALSRGTGVLGYSANPIFSSPDGGRSPAFNWNNGFPAYQHPPFFDATLGTGYNTTTGAQGGGTQYDRPDTAGRPPYTENYNFTFEQQFTPATVLRLSYAGSESHHLPDTGSGNAADLLAPRYAVLGGLLTRPYNPTTLAQAQAIIPGIQVPYPTFVGSIGQMLRPYPQYNYVADVWSGNGASSYHSLQTLLQHTMSSGFYLLASYTWSKEMDDTGGNAYFGASLPGFPDGGPRDPYNFHLERSVGSVDRTHVVSIAEVIQLPFGRGHFLGGNNKYVNSVIGGFQISGIESYASGTPLGPFIMYSSCTTGLLYYGNGCYADYNPSFGGSPRINGGYGSGPPALVKSGRTYLNPAAFQATAPYSLGNTPRTAAYGLRNPISLNEDVSLSKSFSLFRESSLKLQADAFNVFNRTVFGAINTNLDSIGFGTVNAQANSPRKLQFEAYIRF